MRVLHFAVDEKFIPFAQGVFEEAFPGSNRFRVARNRNGGGFFSAGGDAKLVSRWYWHSKEMLDDLAWAECLVVHFLSRRFARAVLMAPPGTQVVWHGWGKDYYGLLDGYADRMHLPITSAYLKERAGKRFWKREWKSQLRNVATQIVDDFIFGNAIERSLSRIDLISMLPDEFDLLKRSHTNVTARFHQLYYSCAETTFAHGPAAMEGPDILLGNSASPTNNHLDAFRELKKLDLTGRRILVPLSYGDSDYARHIVETGIAVFGDIFVPLRHFMPLPDYLNSISRCGTVVMNHVRQQATGNVSIALLKGAKVFLREENLLTPFYRRLGATISSFPGSIAAREKKQFFCPLTPSERTTNANVVRSYWARSTVVSQAKALANFGK
jgi:hypothetical protein